MVSILYLIGEFEFVVRFRRPSVVMPFALKACVIGTKNPSTTKVHEPKAVGYFGQVVKVVKL
jgi:hypothetical protein